MNITFEGDLFSEKEKSAQNIERVNEICASENCTVEEAIHKLQHEQLVNDFKDFIVRLPLRS